MELVILLVSCFGKNNLDCSGAHLQLQPLSKLRQEGSVS
jgi:hypothetical protein